MRKVRTLQILFIILALLSASLACNLPKSADNQPPTSVPMVPEGPEQLEGDIIATLASAAPGQEVTLVITQQQMNAYLASKMTGQNEPTISDPVVVLTNNQIEIFGKIVQSGFAINSKMVLQPQIDVNGEPKLKVISIDLGVLPVSDTITDRVETMVNNALADYVAVGSNRFHITDIMIGEGQMTVSGMVQQP